MKHRGIDAKSFEEWYEKLQSSQSIAAWMISADLPKGIAKVIWYTRQQEIDQLTAKIAELEKKLGNATNIIETLSEATNMDCHNCKLVATQFLKEMDSYELALFRNQRINSPQGQDVQEHFGYKKEEP